MNDQPNLCEPLPAAAPERMPLQDIVIELTAEQLQEVAGGPELVNW